MVRETVVKIAVIGAGIAGLSVSHYLDPDHSVTLYEARDRPGGHTNTVEFEWKGDRISVDTGFIVYNDRTYPGFEDLLEQLEVETEPTTMSFSVRCEKSGLEYAGKNLNALFAQRANLFRPSFYRLIRDILSFNRNASAALDRDSIPDTLGQFLEDRNYSEQFIDKYLIPMAAAIWSSPHQQIRDFPFETFVNFFENHGLLQVFDRPTWYTIPGGGRQYVSKLLDQFDGQLNLGRPVKSVRGNEQSVKLRTAEGTESFDAVVMALHGNQALDILDPPTPAERDVLGAMSYQENNAVLHTDRSVLPDNERSWSAWNVLLADDVPDAVQVSYNMNILQHIESPDPLCVSLNLTDRIDSANIIREFTYEHPVYDLDSNQARDRWSDINGDQNIFYAGAYWRYGFHEDGVYSAKRVVDSIEERIV